MVAEFLETMIGTGKERAKYNEYVDTFSTMFDEDNAFDEKDIIPEYLNEVRIHAFF